MKVFLVAIVLNLLARVVYSDRNTFGGSDDEEAPVVYPNFVCTEAKNYTHPEKCSSFIHCDDSLRAFEYTCPFCSDIVRCPDGRLHYNAANDECDWADIAACVRPSTTEDPNRCEIGCLQEGDCDCFKTCTVDNSSSTTGGVWVDYFCDNGLFWNPDVQNGHGGSCDFWENLSEAVKDKYRYDEKCSTPPVDCLYEPDPNCDNKYFFLPEGSKNLNMRELKNCPTSPSGVHLFWNQNNLSCGKNCLSNPCKVC